MTTQSDFKNFAVFTVDIRSVEQKTSKEGKPYAVAAARLLPGDPGPLPDLPRQRHLRPQPEQPAPRRRLALRIRRLGALLATHGPGIRVEGETEGGDTTRMSKTIALVKCQGYISACLCNCSATGKLVAFHHGNNILVEWLRYYILFNRGCSLSYLSDTTHHQP